VDGERHATAALPPEERPSNHSKSCAVIFCEINVNFAKKRFKKSTRGVTLIELLLLHKSDFKW